MKIGIKILELPLPACDEQADRQMDRWTDTTLMAKSRSVLYSTDYILIGSQYSRLVDTIVVDLDWHLNGVLTFLPLLLPRDAMQARPMSSAVSVCLSVRPSVTFVSCVKTNKRIIKTFSQSDSHAILVFPC